jgi:SPP1 family predicted phage head-tail adaptor
VTIRYRPGVTSAMRVRYQGRKFNILTVLDVEMAHVALELTCAEGLVDA